jgi:hypothetical protein
MSLEAFTSLLGGPLPLKGRRTSLVGGGKRRGRFLCLATVGLICLLGISPSLPGVLAKVRQLLRQDICQVI